MAVAPAEKSINASSFFDFHSLASGNEGYDSPLPDSLRRLGYTTRYEAGSVICEEGVPTSEVLIIHQGCAQVTIASVDGRSFSYRIGKGALISAGGLTEQNLHDTHAVAFDEGCEVFTVDAGVLKREISVRSDASLDIIVVMLGGFAARETAQRKTGKLYFAVREIGQRKTPRTYVGTLIPRVARELEIHVDLDANPGEGRIVTRPISQDEMARNVAATREAVGTILGKLRREGVIDKGPRYRRGHSYVIVDFAKLQDFQRRAEGEVLRQATRWVPLFKWLAGL